MIMLLSISFVAWRKQRKKQAEKKYNRWRSAKRRISKFWSKWAHFINVCSGDMHINWK